jgi:hypothetical protein
VFAQPEIVEQTLEWSARKKGHRPIRKSGPAAQLIPQSSLTREALAKSVLLGLAEQMGEEISDIRGSALRRSVELPPSRTILNTDEYLEPHRRGEVLVAAMMQTFLEVWTNRLGSLRRFGRFLNVKRVAEEGSAAADYLLTMAIRALDYTPPVHLDFGDFLSAMLTADTEIRPDDGSYQYRRALLRRFRSFGIDPASIGSHEQPGTWTPITESNFSIDRTHFEPLQHDADEVFAFIWENRKAL